MSDQNYEAGTVGQLTTGLQKAALGLIKHYGTNNFRIRIDGVNSLTCCRLFSDLYFFASGARH
jgi:hypothetical protein